MAQLMAVGSYWVAGSCLWLFGNWGQPVYCFDFLTIAGGDDAKSDNVRGALTLDGGGGTARGVEDRALPLNIEKAARKVASGQDKSTMTSGRSR